GEAAGALDERAGGGADLVDRDFSQRRRFLALAGALAEVLQRGQLAGDALARSLRQRVVAAGRVEQVAGEARVDLEPFEVYADAAPGDEIALEIVAALFQGFVFEQRPEQRDGLLAVEASGREEHVRRAVAERDVD